MFSKSGRAGLLRALKSFDRAWIRKANPFLQRADQSPDIKFARPVSSGRPNITFIACMA